MTIRDRLRARVIDWLGIKAQGYPAWFDDAGGAEIGLPRLYDARA